MIHSTKYQKKNKKNNNKKQRQNSGSTSESEYSSHESTTKKKRNRNKKPQQGTKELEDGLCNITINSNADSTGEEPEENCENSKPGKKNKRKKKKPQSVIIMSDSCSDARTNNSEDEVQSGADCEEEEWTDVTYKSHKLKLQNKLLYKLDD